MAALLRMRLGGAWRMGCCPTTRVFAVWRAAADCTPASWSSSSGRGVKSMHDTCRILDAHGNDRVCKSSQEVHALTNYQLQMVHQPHRPGVIGPSAVVHSTGVL